MATTTITALTSAGTLDGTEVAPVDKAGATRKTTLQEIADLADPATIGAALTSHTHGAANIVSGTLATARLGSGTANNTTFLRGDQTWAVPASGSGDSYLRRIALGN